MATKIATRSPNSYLFLSGGEAVARAALEANVKVAAAYPGTPSTEILETIAEVSKQFGIHAEWSVNEIVAVEVAIGASMTGTRSIAIMKHVGLNVASDAVMTLAYTGVIGGLVLVVCDDPGIHSSQNEQDTRYFAVHSNIPLMDAGNPQEAYEMAKEAFEISEELQLPILLRLTTRVAHSKARVKIGDFQNLGRKAKFDSDVCQWVMVPQNARRMSHVLKDKLVDAEKLAEKSRFNVIEDNCKDVGIVGSGVGFYHAKSVLDPGQFCWLKLGFVYPFPSEIVRKFASKLKRLIVIEELRSYIESNLKGLDVAILGKSQLGLSEIGEFTPDDLTAAFAKLGYCKPAEPEPDLDLPIRQPVLCAGCPHRALFYSLKSAGGLIVTEKDAQLVDYTQDDSSFNRKRKSVYTGKIVTGDIGCYSLGFLPPTDVIQTCLCMGAGISQAAGMVHAGVKEKLFAVIGDSTFFHSGMPGLLNIAYNKANVCVVILDNCTIAMTGHQPTPGSGKTATGENAKIAKLEDIVKSLGIDRVEIVDPYDIKKTTQTLKETIDYEGPAVVISRRPCTNQVLKGHNRIIQDTCVRCGLCVETLGCPAISLGIKHAEIDDTICAGCGICESICPTKAIKERRER